MTSSHGGGWCDFAWLKLLFLFVLSFTGTFSNPAAPAQTYHRCRSMSRNETSTSLLQDLQQSQCRPCEYDLTTAMGSITADIFNELYFASSPSEMHVVVLLTTQNTFEKCMVTTSGLLTRGIRVTMLSAPNMPPESAIRPALSQHMPCDQQATAQALLTFKTYYYNPQSLPCLVYGQELLQSSGDVIYCSILNAAPLVQGISEALAHVDQPSVLLMDATSIAGLLIAEHFLIPSLMIVEHIGGLRHVLGDPLAHVPVWHPAYLYRMIQDRLVSVDLTSAFMALNRVRRTLGLRRLRTVADLWRAPGSVLWSSMPEARQWQPIMPNLLVYSGPFLPPCVPCDAQLLVTKENATQQQSSLSSNKALSASHHSSNATHSHDTKEPSVIVSAAFRNDEAGRRQLRSLINGLVFARESIRHLNEACPVNATNNCWRGPQDFRIVLTGPKIEDFIFPPFVYNVESAFLDILATFEPTVALVSLCDPGNSWTRTLGPPVLCLDLRWSPRELAQNLLLIMKNHQAQQHALERRDGEDDVLHKIIHVLEEMSKIKARDGINWSTGWEMGRDIINQLDIPADGRARDATKQPSESVVPSVLLYPAYGILCIALLYFLTKDSLQGLALSRTLWLSRRHARMISAALTHGLLSRLVELEIAWNMWKAWVTELSSQMAESGSALSPRNLHHNEKHNGIMENGSGHGRKRPKSSKKRN